MYYYKTVDRIFLQFIFYILILTMSKFTVIVKESKEFLLTKKVHTIVIFFIFLILWSLIAFLFTLTNSEKEPVVKVETNTWTIAKVEKNLFKASADWNIHFLISWLATSPENKNNLVVYVKINKENKKVSIINIDSRTVLKWTKIQKMNFNILTQVFKSTFWIENLYWLQVESEQIEKLINANWWKLSFYKNTAFNSEVDLEKELTTFIWDKSNKQQILQNMFVYFLLWAKQKEEYKTYLQQFLSVNWFEKDQIGEFEKNLDLNKFKNINSEILSIADKPTFYSSDWSNTLTLEWIEIIKSY